MNLVLAGLFVIGVLTLNANWVATTAGNDIKSWLILIGWAAVTLGCAIVLWLKRGDWRNLS